MMLLDVLVRFFVVYVGSIGGKKAHGCTLGEESATLIFALGIENGKEQPGCRVPTEP